MSSSSSDIDHDNQENDDLNEGGHIHNEQTDYNPDDEWGRDIELEFYKKSNRVKVSWDHQGVEEGETGFKVKFRHHHKKKRFMFVVAQLGIRILDFKTLEELTRFSFDRIMKFLYNKDLHIFQFMVKLTPITVERYTFHTKKCEEIFFTIKEKVAQNIEDGVGKTKKLVQAKVKHISTHKDRKEMTVDKVKEASQGRQIVDVLTRDKNTEPKQKKKPQLSMLDITDQTEKNFKRKSAKRVKSARHHRDNDLPDSPPDSKKEKRPKSSRKEKKHKHRKSHSKIDDNMLNAAPTTRARSRSDAGISPIKPSQAQTDHLKSSIPLISLEDSDMEVFDL